MAATGNTHILECLHRSTRRRIRRTIVQAMACLVVFCTTYALILPAITMETTWCGLEAHTHTDACLEKIIPAQHRTLHCSEETLGLHAHTDDCYAEDALICGIANFVVHTHDENCVDADGRTVCTLEVIEAHTHADDCYTEIPGHEHTDSCYTPERGALTCPLPETPGHAHTEGCRTQGEQICTLAEQEGHTHGESCVETVLGCTLTTEPHVHRDPDCYRQLECTLPEDETHTHTDECNGKVLSCDLTEQPHNHTASCYVTNTICQLPEAQAHTHGHDCYRWEITCTVPEEAPHAHTDGCYETVSTLTCQEEVKEAETVLTCEKEEIILHTHDEEKCYETFTDENGDVQKKLICTQTVVTEHIHSDACFRITQDPGTDPEQLTCEIPENHVHGEGCYDGAQTLICALPTDHTHEDLCYGQWELICTLPEHTHTLACRSNPEADLETQENWTAAFAGDTLSGDWSADVLTIAQSQLGYQASTQNYTVLEDGSTIRGYSRYGAWSGDPYAPWNTLFAMFCLHYGGVQEVSTHADAQQWQQLLASDEAYHSAEGYVPAPGQLVFLSGEPIRVAIVEDSVTENEVTTFTAIQGDSQGQVACTRHSPSEVLGYLDLSQVRTRYERSHVHTDTCYTTETVCGLPHVHSEDCVDAEGSTVCTMDPEAPHEHTESCYARVLTCTVGQNLPPQIEYLCGLEEHTHADACRDEQGVLTCTLPEHTHYILCTDPEAEPCCLVPEHSHDETCPESCQSFPHSHVPACYDQILSLGVMIDLLPTADEAEAAVLAYEEDDDMDGLGAYYKRISDLAKPIYNAYIQLSPKEQALVTNYAKLQDLAWIWDATTYEVHLSRYTYNPEYETDDYHRKWTTPGTWITKSDDPLVHINEPVPDKYTIDGLMLGAKGADSVSVSFTPLFSTVPSNSEARAKTGFTWTALAGTGMDCCLGANLLLPSDSDAKEALVGTDDLRTHSVYAYYKNIGTYKDKQINLRISVVDYENYVDWTTNTVTEGVLGFWTMDNRSSQPSHGQRLIGISACGISWVQLLYEFVDNDGNEINVKGSTTFYDLDFGQSVHIRAGDTKLMGIYVTDVTASVPNLKTVNGYTTRDQQRAYFENWPADDCVLKYSNDAPVGTGSVVYSAHGNDSGLDTEQYGDTKHAFTVAFERNNINIVYGFDKGKSAVSGTNAAGELTYAHNANGGVIHSSVPVYTGSLQISKEITGFPDGEDPEFRFQITFHKKAGSTAADTSLDGRFGNVTLTDGVGTFTLKHGETITLTGIPIRENGTPFTVTELDYGRYIPSVGTSFQLSGEDPVSVSPTTGDSYRGVLYADNNTVQRQNVLFQNYLGPVLPETGSTGTALFTLPGLLLSAAALTLLHRRKRSRTE